MWPFRSKPKDSKPPEVEELLTPGDYWDVWWSLKKARGVSDEVLTYTVNVAVEFADAYHEYRTGRLTKHRQRLFRALIVSAVYGDIEVTGLQQGVLFVLAQVNRRSRRK